MSRVTARSRVGLSESDDCLGFGHGVLLPLLCGLNRHCQGLVLLEPVWVGQQSSTELGTRWDQWLTESSVML